MSEIRRRAWSLLTISEGQQYGGNTGYGDDPERLYRYDSEVANSLQLSKDDLVVLRDREHILGAAIVSKVVPTRGLKKRLRCPKCKTASIKERTKRTPRWRCKNGHEFEYAKEEKVRVTKFAALYGHTFCASPSPISSGALKQAAFRPSDQVSIEEIDPGALMSKVGRKFPGLKDLLQLFGQLQTIAPTDADGDLPLNGKGTPAYKPGKDDQRKKALRSITVRRGQKKFRDALFKRYGKRCMISRCALLHIVEAAHIAPYRRDEDNHPENGLLLRPDLHTLYDLDLLGIEPSSLKIAIAPEVARAGYRNFHGKKLVLRSSLRPSRKALVKRWRVFRLHYPALRFPARSQ